MIIVEPAVDRASRRRFVEFPYALYSGHPQWVPQLRLVERARFNTNHPFFAHADVQLFLARRNGRVVGRIAAIDDRLHNEKHGDNLGSFGHFEAESEDAAYALLDAAEGWARARGRRLMRGPLNSSLNEAAGLLVSGFETPPMVLMPYNPPTYPPFFARRGYAKVKDLLAWIIDLPLERPPALLVRAGVRIRARHTLTIRSVDMSDFDREIERFVGVYCRAWQDNWGFVEPTRAEVRQLASELRYVVDRDLVLAADVNGAMVGCAIALPDLNQVFAGTKGRLVPGLLRLLTRKRYVTQARVLLFGVVPEWRISGVAGPLIIELLSRTATLYRRAELSWVLEDNDSTNASVAALGGHVYKTYRIYQKDLGA